MGRKLGMHKQVYTVGYLEAKQCRLSNMKSDVKITFWNLTNLLIHSIANILQLVKTKRIEAQIDGATITADLHAYECMQ